MTWPMINSCNRDIEYQYVWRVDINRDIEYQYVWRIDINRDIKYRYVWRVDITFCSKSEQYVCNTLHAILYWSCYIRVITKLPNSEQSYKGKVKTHNYINRQNQSTTGKLWKP